MESTLAPHTRRFTLPRSPKLLALTSDERLVSEIRAGNEAAFEAVYDRYHRQLLSFCRHLLGSHSEAEDALQQTFASAYSALLAGDADVRLKPWLFTIARNRSVSMLRRRPTAELDAEPSTTGLHEQVSERAELREMLADLQRLPEDQRAALIMSELRGFAHEDVAEVLGCAPQKVKSLVFQARTHLMEFRSARATPCREIREELSVRRRGAPSRRVRQHVSECAACSEFRAQLKQQRRHLAVLLAVVPAAGLRAKAFAAAGVSGCAGGGSAGGGLAGLGVAKVAAIAATGAAGVAVVGATIVGPPRGAEAQRPHGATIPHAQSLFQLSGGKRGGLLAEHVFPTPATAHPVARRGRLTRAVVPRRAAHAPAPAPAGHPTSRHHHSSAQAAPLVANTTPPPHAGLGGRTGRGAPHHAPASHHAPPVAHTHGGRGQGHGQGQGHLQPAPSQPHPDNGRPPGQSGPQFAQTRGEGNHNGIVKHER